MRPLHCTLLGLRPAISPNVGNSGAQFMVVGVCVRAAPVLFFLSIQKAMSCTVMPVTCITSQFSTRLGGAAFGPPTFFPILTDSGVLTGGAVPKRVG